MHVEGTGEGVTEPRELLTPTEVGKALKVDPKTVTRWIAKGLLRGIKTPGGQNRCYRTDIEAIVNGEAE
jgi:excisionase family DNA binding protein